MLRMSEKLISLPPQSAAKVVVPDPVYGFRNSGSTTLALDGAWTEPVIGHSSSLFVSNLRATANVLEVTDFLANSKTPRGASPGANKKISPIGGKYSRAGRLALRASCQS